ncbi:MAG: hypothetical protein RR555_06865 [Bacteroidales bacterium]
MKATIQLWVSLLFSVLLWSLSVVCNAQEQKTEDSIAVCMRNFKYKDALVKLDAARALHPQDSVKNLLLQSKCYKKLYLFPQSIAILEKLSRMDTTNVQLLEELADCRLLNGDYKGCAGVYTKMLQLDSTNTYFEMQRALVNVKGEYYPAALAGFNNLYSRGDSTNHIILRLLGDCHYFTGDGNMALLYYNKAIQARPTDQLAVKKLTILYMNIKMPEKAVVITDNYIKLDSTNREVNMWNGIARYVTRDFEGAIKVLDTLAAHGDDSYSTNYYLGLSKAAILHFYEAIPHLTVAYEYDTTNVDVVYHLGNAYCCSWGKEARGLELLNQGLKEMQPKVENLVKYNVSKANGYAGLRNYDEAIKCLETAYKLDKEYTPALYQIATYYEYQKKKLKAAEYYRDYVIKNIDKKMINVARMRYSKLQEELFMEGIELKPLPLPVK